MEVSMNWGVLSVGVFIIRALLFGVYIGAPDFWKVPYRAQTVGKPCGSGLQQAPCRTHM